MPYVVFSSARNLRVLHLSSPCSKELSLGLQGVTGQVTWSHLRDFKLKYAKIRNTELLDVLRRHESTLQALSS